MAEWPQVVASSRPLATVVGFAVILLIGVLNFFATPQLSPSFFYLLPIMFISHVAGPKAGVPAALLAAGLWLLADLMPPSIYDNAWQPGTNALMRVGVFLVVVWLLTTTRNLTNSLEQRVADRSAALSRESAERRALEKRILEISEREQARMGQDLHDGLCQHLVGMAFSTNLLHQKLLANGQPGAVEVGKLASLLDDSISQARQLARGLYPVRIEDLGLAIALEDLAETVKGIYHVNCEFAFHDEAIELEQSVAVHLYRIAQEAVTNAAKHAHPGLIKIELPVTASTVELRVEDDGVGMPAGPEKSSGMGLRIMEFRARMIGARFRIDSRPSGGTVVSCTLPMPQATS